MTRRRAILWGAIFLLVAAPASWAASVAVVTHPEVPVDELSLPELRRIVMGDRQFWSPQLRVTLLMGAPGARERDVVLRKLYKMTEAQFRHHWMAKVFRAEVPAGPKVVYSSDAAVEMVAKIPGSVAFVDATDVPDGLKVLRIEGSLPDREGYPLD